jgi:hypothetical protein
MPKKSVSTPEDQVHIVAAILAAGLGSQAPTSTDKPNSVHSLTVQRYRQFVRMLSRSTERGQDESEEE